MAKLNENDSLGSVDVVSTLAAQTGPLVAIVSGAAVAGIGVAVAKWGFPIGVQMFKSLAKK